MSLSGFEVNNFYCSSPKIEDSPLCPQQRMKYGSSPFYFECELTAHFFSEETAAETSVGMASPTNFM